MAGVPQVHLGVELAVPAVREEAFLLRRPLTGGVHRGEVLRQHDAPLELRRARIGAPREIDHAAVVPVRGPRSGAPTCGRHRRWVAAAASGASENATISDERLAPAGGHTKGVRACLLLIDGAIRPGGDGVAGVVDAPLERQRARVAPSHRRLVRLGVRPVGGIRVELLADAGERQIDAEAARGQQRRSEPDDHRVERRMDARLHLHRCALEHEAALEPAGPEVERLPGPGQIGERRAGAIGLREVERQPAERDPVRVLAQPLDVRLARLVPVAEIRIRPRLPADVDGLVGLRDREPGRVGKAVPGPLGLDHQRHARRVLLLERLQAGDVGGKAEVAVAHHQRRRRIDARERRVVPGDERAAIDRRRTRLAGRRRRRDTRHDSPEETRADHPHR